MIWQSPLVMGLIDAAIVLAALAVMVVFYRHRRTIRSLRLNINIAWIALGLSVMALFHAGDLVTMLVLPVLTSPETAMVAMTKLHLQWSWLVSLMAAASIAIGLFGLLSRLLPRIRESMPHLQAESEARRRAEAALRESEGRYWELFSKMGTCVAIYEGVDDGLDFVFKDFNHAAEKTENLRKAEVLGRRVTEAFPGVVEIGLLDVFQRVWKTGRSEYFPVTFYEDDRISGWRQNYVYKLPSSEIVSVYEDATEKNRAEEDLRKARDELELRVEELRQSEQGLANAQRMAHMGNWEWNLVTNDLFWSDEVYRIFGLSPQKFGVTYESFFEAIHPDDRTLVTTAVNEAIEAHQPYSIEYRLQRPDGTVRFVHEHWEVIYGDDDAPLRMSGTVQDITESKQVEDALRESQVWLSRAQSLAKLGFWDWSFIADGTQYWSDNASEILGVPLDDLYGSYEEYLKLVHPDDRDFVRETYVVSYPSNDEDSSGYNIDYRLLRPDGSVIWINEIADPKRDESGRPDRKIGSFQDITERKLIEEEIRRLNEHLEALVEERTLELRDAQADLVRKERLAALGQLTATVNHELRNPLGALRNAVAVMKRNIDDDNPLLAESAGIADRSINRCDAIISDLFDYTRVRPLNLTPISVDQWLDGLLDEYRLSEGIELRREFASDVVIRFDSERIRRILLNLLDNATQAMIGDEQATRAPGGGHVLTVASRMGNGRLEIVIGDTGPGIPSDIRGEIFEPLFSTKSFGVGLGLPIVMQIAKQHGGGVEVSKATGGGGAEFTLWLPMAAPELQEVS